LALQGMLKMDGSRLIVSGDLSEFFRQELSDARDTLGIELSELVEFYIVNLLCEFSRAGGSLETIGDEPLALLYKRALEASGAERQQILKSIGDVSLYLAGFFTESIDRSLVDVRYYISMGGNAYGSLSDLVAAERRKNVFFELYRQLAKRFADFVDLLNQISERAREKSDRDSEVLRLYERWLRTGSLRLQRLLAERGVLVREGLPADYNQ
jgi:hypothetical protein